MTNYKLPFTQLLELGESCVHEADWVDYLGFGFTKEHIPELIRMATDKGLHTTKKENFDWAPLHAWRTLGQLKAMEALAPLLQMLDETELGDDWLLQEIPEISKMIGLPAISVLDDYLKTSSHGVMSRASAGECLVYLALNYPATREDVLKSLMAVVENYQKNDPSLNALLICQLIELKASTAAFMIKKAFDDNAVDLEITGNWEDVQTALGLDKTVRTIEPQTGRNDLCPCGSGKKFKKCCLEKMN